MNGLCDRLLTLALSWNDNNRSDYESNMTWLKSSTRTTGVLGVLVLASLLWLRFDKD